MSRSANRFNIRGCLLIGLMPIFGILFSPSVCGSQTVLEELRGRYRLVYDSTFIWPDGEGGFDYVRRFISDVILAEKGKDVLSRPATPVLEKEDTIEITAYTTLPSGEIHYADSTDLVTRTFPDGARRIFVNFRQPEPGATLHFEWILISKKVNIAGKRFLGRTVAVDSAVIIITVPETWIFNFAVSPAFSAREEKLTERMDDGPARVSYFWIAANLGALRMEEFSPPVHRMINCVYFSLSLDAGWPDPELHKVSWAKVAKLYYSEIEDFIKESSSIDRVVDSLGVLVFNDREAAEAAFDWARGNFIPQYPDLSLSKRLDEVIERGRGTRAEEAAILYAILQKLAVPCAPYLAASHDAGDPMPELPGLFWFDRVLVACFLDGDTIWTDPSYPAVELGILPFEDQNVPVLRLDEATGEFASTPDIDYHDNAKAIHLRLDIDSSGALYGEATEIYSGALIAEISSYIFSLEEEQRKEPWERKLAKSFPGVKLIRFVSIPPVSAGEAYRVGYTFTTGPIIRPFARRAYIPMDLLGRWEDLPGLPSGNRQFPIELRRPRFEFERITLNISPALEVEYIPRNFSMNSHIGEIYSVARKDGNTMTITRGFGLKRSKLPVSAYKSLRRFFNAARAEADKQIILRRID